MSRDTRPKNPPKRPRETAESKQFRAEMASPAPTLSAEITEIIAVFKREHPDHVDWIDTLAREHPDRIEAMVEAVKSLRDWSSNGTFDLDSCDMGAIARLTRFITAVDLSGERIPVVCPKVQVADAATFDAALCKAGLKRYVRSRHCSETKFNATFILVTELQPGVWSREEIGGLPE
jgi:hypothetical protein